MTTDQDETLIAIGNNLRRLRKQAKVSQEHLALEAEIDRTYVSQIERGVANPSILVLKKIATCLDVPLSDLIVDV